MFLLIDIGNTRVKFACHDGAQWVMRDAIDRNAFSTADLSLPAGFTPERIVIANVAGDAAAADLRRQLTDWQDRTEWLRADKARCGLSNEYEQPARLGADRWAAAIGAWHLVGDACLVVSAGTATTIDVLQDGGIFAGGCILPGLTMMRTSLASGTANLPEARGIFSSLPRNTHDAITTGCLHAQLGAIARMHQQLPAGSPIVITGGAADQIVPHLPAPVVHEPWLVLEGLLRIAQAPT